MISTALKHPHTAGFANFGGTRQQFMLALYSLGAGIEPAACDATLPHLRRVLLGCSYEQWANVIGQLPPLADHFAPGGGVAFQTWQYRCDDGFLVCIGRKHDGGEGRQFVSVRAVYF